MPFTPTRLRILVALAGAILLTPVAAPEPNAHDTGFDVAHDVIITPDGTLAVVTGASQAPDGTFDLTVTAYDADTGDESWTMNWRTPDGRDVTPADVAVTADGALVVATGTVTEPPRHEPFPHGTTTHADYVTVAVNSSTGEVEWVAEERARAPPGIRNVASATDGTLVFVAGSTREPADLHMGRSHVTVFAYDAMTGARAWTWTDVAELTRGVAGVAVAPDGSRVLVAHTMLTNAGVFGHTVTVEAPEVIALDTSTGVPAWRSPHPSVTAPGPAGALALTSDGDTAFIAAVARASVTTGPEGRLRVIAVDAATGLSRWDRTFAAEGGSVTRVEDVAVDPDGARFYAVARAETPLGRWAVNVTYATLAVDSVTGHRAWQVAQAAGMDAGSINHILPRATLAVTPDGSRVITAAWDREAHAAPGGSTWFGWADYLTIAHDAATGEPVWAALFDGPLERQDAATGVAIHPDGSRVIVTGSMEDTRVKQATLAYDVTDGSELWQATYTRPVANA